MAEAHRALRDDAKEGALVNPGRPEAPTRSNLLRSRRRSERVDKGIELLTRKRRALVAELFRVASPAIEAREALTRKAGSAYEALLSALAAEGMSGLEVTGWPTRQVEVEVETRETWGVTVGAVQRLSPVRRSLVARGQGPAMTGLSTMRAAGEFEHYVELLLDLASTELLLHRLADALARTSRQVEVLERRVQPELAHRIRRIGDALSEREREDHMRLRLFAGRSR